MYSNDGRISPLILSVTGAGGYRSLYQEDWKPTTERDFVTFWYDTVTDNDIREIIGPDTLRTKGKCL